jgi:hypothetical protein
MAKEDNTIFTISILVLIFLVIPVSIVSIIYITLLSNLLTALGYITAITGTDTSNVILKNNFSEVQKINDIVKGLLSLNVFALISGIVYIIVFFMSLKSPSRFLIHLLLSSSVISTLLSVIGTALFFSLPQIVTTNLLGTVTGLLGTDPPTDNTSQNNPQNIPMTMMSRIING